MEQTDIEDGEILDDECSDDVVQNKFKTESNDNSIGQEQEQEPVAVAVVNSISSQSELYHMKKDFFSLPSSKYEKEADGGSNSLSDKRKKPFPTKQEEEKENSLKNRKRHFSEEVSVPDNEDETILILGGSLQENQGKSKLRREPLLPDPPAECMRFSDRHAYYDEENEDVQRSFNSMGKEHSRRDHLPRRGGPKRRAVGNSFRKGKATENCLFFMQGNCHRGSDCSFIHDVGNHSQPRKPELCKFYLNDCCTKKEKCTYMHSEFPCKYFHTGSKCFAGKNCKFNHGKLDDAQRNILIKHLETAPLEIVGDFGRAFRESGSSISRKECRPLKTSIPSLFDIKVTIPNDFKSDEYQHPSPCPPESNTETVEERLVEDDVLGHRESHKHNMKMLETNENVEKEQNIGSHRKKRSSEKSRHYRSDSEEKRYLEKELRKISRREQRHHKRRHNGHSDKTKTINIDSSLKELKNDGKIINDEEKWNKRRYESDDNRKKYQKVEEGNESYGMDQLEVSKHKQESIPVENKKPKLELTKPYEGWEKLPIIQKQLYLRIKNKQKDYDNSNDVENQNEFDTNNEEVEDVDVSGVNWYSSDEESTPSCSSLETGLQNLNENKLSPTYLMNTVSSTVVNDQFSNSTSTVTQTSHNLDLSAIITPSQLANINISEDITKVLTTIRMQTEANQASTTHSDEASTIYTPSVAHLSTDISAPSSAAEIMSHIRQMGGKQPEFTDSAPITSTDSAPITSTDSAPITSTDQEDVDIDEITSNIEARILSLIGNQKKEELDISKLDMNSLPFKPVPQHDTANEIDASITSHPPMVYKLVPLANVGRPNYTALRPFVKFLEKDPRFQLPDSVSASQTPPPQLSSVSGKSDNLPTSIHTKPFIGNRNDPRLSRNKFFTQNPIVGNVNLINTSEQFINNYSSMAHNLQFANTANNSNLFNVGIPPPSMVPVANSFNINSQLNSNMTGLALSSDGSYGVAINTDKITNIRNNHPRLLQNRNNDGPNPAASYPSNNTSTTQPCLQDVVPQGINNPRLSVNTRDPRINVTRDPRLNAAHSKVNIRPNDPRLNNRPDTAENAHVPHQEDIHHIPRLPLPKDLD